MEWDAQNLGKRGSRNSRAMENDVLIGKKGCNWEPVSIDIVLLEKQESCTGRQSAWYKRTVQE